MSKRRRNPWDEDAFDFNANASSLNETNLYDQEGLVVEPELLEEAHEALSKLFNKTNKRGKQMRGVRRKDAWQ